MSHCSETERLTYRLHGTTLETSFPLACAASPERRPQFRHVTGESFEEAPSEAQSLALLRIGEIGYHAVEREGSIWVNFFHECEFSVTAQGAVNHRLQPAGDPRLVELFLANAVMALALGARGVPLLHASCVELDGLGLAVVGASGAGKSSIAAALCAAGAGLVSDDTLRIDCSAIGASCFSGTSRLRLRPAAEILARRLEGPATRSSDGRLSVSLPSEGNSYPLRCVWVPEVVAPTAPLTLTPFLGHARLMSLLSNVRISGWAPEAMVRFIPLLRQIAASVSVYHLRIPESLIFTEAGPQQLYSAARAATSSSFKP